MAKGSERSKRTSGQRKAASGKRAAMSSRRKAVGSTGRTAAVSGRTSARRSARAAIVAPGGGTIRIVCRECHEDWVVDMDAAREQEMLTCPVCEHRARAPSDDILHQIKLYKGMEQRNLTLAIASTLVGLFSAGFWLVLTHNPANAREPAIFYGPLALAGIALIATLVFAARYERSKWETYF
ncbi:MAG: hypothetical protein KatS3mg102_2144 [Planctomycetota bacterium]|nr:MAG: hypothetical protein KatS3mg102_2144 [Planctomycetota bacterium]